MIEGAFVAMQFTIDAGTAGITDQLLTLEFLGCLGRAAGWHFVYSRPHLSRSHALPETNKPSLWQRITRRIHRMCSGAATGDLFDTLGTAIALKRASGGRHEDGSALKVTLSDELLEASGASCFEDCRDMCLTMAGAADGQHNSIVLSWAGPKRSFRHLYQGSGPSFLEHYKCYREVRDTIERRRTLFCPDRVRVCIHFRAGDLGMLRCDDQFVSVSSKSPCRFVECSDPRRADPSWVEFNELRPHITELSTQVSARTAQQCEVVFNSDGFCRSFNVLSRLAAPEIRRRYSPLAENYDAHYFAEAINECGANALIGETDTHLVSLLDCAMDCDIAIVNGRGGLIPKLFAIMERCGWATPPVLVFERGDRYSPYLIAPEQFNSGIFFANVDAGWREQIQLAVEATVVRHNRRSSGALFVPRVAVTSPA